MRIIKVDIDKLDLVTPLFDAYRVFYQQQSDQLGAVTFLKERIENNESVIFLAVDEHDNAAGFVQLYPLFSSTRMQRLWLLNDLYVESDYRRMGIAKLLLERAKAHCVETGARGFFLETGMDNVEGNKLYPAVGMTLNDDNNFYWWDV